MKTLLPDFQAVYESLPGDGWLSESEAHLLWSSAVCTLGNILEVGCYMGRSTALLASIGRTVYAVDPFDGFHDQMTGDAIRDRFWANMKSRHIENVRQFREKIEDWEPRPCGFCYLDGDHSYLGTLAQIAKALLCKPQIIAVHDVNDSGGGLEVKRACKGLGPWSMRVERLAVWNLNSVGA